MPNSHLMRELRWYLEVFLDYPFPPLTDRAERIQKSLELWGTEAFNALFGSRDSGRLFDAATAHQYSSLHLEVSSDAPKILHWPWEALRDVEVGVIARTCQISRRLNKVRDPNPLSDQLPKDGIHILLVTARPFEADVQYRSISRPLVELIANKNLPATVTLLRPPTFDQLRAHLRANPNRYHILHFDGHGSYGSGIDQANPHALTLQGSQGQLIFEDAEGKPDPQRASVLSELLREFCVPIVVLNACQSAMVDDQADDAFASVAAGLQKSGVRSVVAMAYSLYVSGAQQFLPAFYQRLFETGRVADAARAGRQQTIAHPNRVCSRGTFPLDDWLVPVLYEQDAAPLNFSGQFKSSESKAMQSIPQEAIDSQNPYGLIGRDGALLTLERAMHRPPAAILVHGLGGIGKTTLSRGFVKWLSDTQGLKHGCFWFSFQEIRSAEFVINDMVGRLFGTNALAQSLDLKLQALVNVLRETAFLIVWDNFEDVRGNPDASIQPNLSAEDQTRLATFLKRLRGGKTKVLITSRSPEDWLDAATCFRFRIGGLVGEERWEYCSAIVRDLGLTVDRETADWQTLINSLDGHPLAMRVILSKLQNATPSQLTAVLEKNLLQFAGQDPESAKLFATLRFVQDQLPADLQQLLIPLALHERYVDADYFKAMAKQLDNPVTETSVDRLLAVLSHAGLLTDIGQGMFEMHPALNGFLLLTVLPEANTALRDAWSRGFVDFMGSLADHFAPKALHEQRGVFHFHGMNFRRALQLADSLEMNQDFAALTQSLAMVALNTRNYQDAGELFLNLADVQAKRGDSEGEAGAYHQLGRIAQEQREFATAETWYRKSLAINEKQGNEHGAAMTYHQLGRIAEEQREFATAETWYRKSLAIKEKQGNEHGAAMTYHQLGIIAQEQQDFPTAEKWYQKSLAITEKQGNEHGAAMTYHQLGIIAQQQRDFPTAEKWYQKSLAINEKQGDEHGAAFTYGQLGRLAMDGSNTLEAANWFLKAFLIFRQEESHYAIQVQKYFLEAYAVAGADDKSRLKDLWMKENLGELPELSQDNQS
jgi:tetratricopeptide (TPR) repeat protein